VPATVKVDQDGRVVDAVIDGLPLTAPDLAACARVALRDMAVPDSVLRLRPDEPPISQQQSAPARGLMGNLLVLGGAIALGEIVAKAFGATLIFAVAAQVVDTGVKEIAELARRRKTWKDECTDHYEVCVASRLVREGREHYKQTRCGLCQRECISGRGWPARVYYGDDYGSCEYWIPGWL
jgi:hypothetical protein